MAAATAANQAIYLNDLINGMGYASQEPMALGIDNKAARDLAYNPEYHDKTKHIPREFFRICDYVENHRLTVPYVNTTDNMADFFTKPLPLKHFISFRDKIMNIGTRSTSTRRLSSTCATAS